MASKQKIDKTKEQPIEYKVLVAWSWRPA